MTRSTASPIALLLSLALAGGHAYAIRPTPHQLIDQALRPVRDQLTQLNPTAAERASVADVVSRGEALAAELIEAQHAGDTVRVASLDRRIALLARWMRGRIEALRAEASATEGERLALAADARLVQARAALERAAEHALEVDRAGEAAPASTTELPATGETPVHPAPVRTARPRATTGTR